MVRLKRLVEDPCRDKDAKDAILVRERDENSEDNQVYDTFGVLAVVHGAHAGNEAEQEGDARVGRSGRRRNAAYVVRNAFDRAGVGGSASRHGLVARRAGDRISAEGLRCASCRGVRGGETKLEARFAEDGLPNGSGALDAQRLTAVLAEGFSFTIGMVRAVHARPLFC